MMNEALSPRRREEITDAAEAILDDFGIVDPSDLLLLDQLTVGLGAEVQYRRMDGCDGRLLWRKRGPLITISERLPPERNRFALGHELGHLTLHHTKTQLFVCTEEDLRLSYRSLPEEREANYFSASLLMPERLVPAGTHRARPDIDAVRSLARFFNVSLTAAALRFVEISRSRCAVVFSTLDGIEWWRGSERFGVLVDTRTRRLDPDSFAYDVLRQELTQKAPSEVDASTWLYFETIFGARLFEHSALLGSTGICLTLLWLKEE